MENKFLIDVSIKYGLDSARVSKLSDMIYQCGISQVDSKEAKSVATFLCENDLLDKPAEELIEELRLKGFTQ